MGESRINSGLPPSAHDHVLFLVVERHPVAAVHRRDGHAQGDRVIVARLDVGVRLLAGAHALHPVPHVGHGGFVAARVRGGFRRHRLPDLRLLQLFYLYPHLSPPPPPPPPPPPHPFLTS